MHHAGGHSTFGGGSCAPQLSGQAAEDPPLLFWGAGQSWMGIGDSPIAKNAQATRSQFSRETQNLVYECGGGNPDWGGDPKVVERRRGTSSPKSLTEYASDPWIEGLGVG